MGTCCSACCADDAAHDVRQHRKQKGSASARRGQNGSVRSKTSSRREARPLPGSSSRPGLEDDAHSLTASLYSADMDDFHSCQDAFSYTGSPLSSPLRLSLDANGQPLSHAHRASQHTAMDTTLLPYPATAVHSSADSSTTPSSPALGCLPLPQAQSQPAQQSFPQPHGGSEDGNPVPKSGCLPDLLGALASNISAPDSPARRLGAAPQPDGSGTGRRRSVGPRAETKASVGAALAGQRCNAGCSLTLRDASVPETSASLCYEPADATHFKVRAVDYATSRLKIHSEQALYELVTADTFGCDTKQEHVARCMNLPPALGPSRCTAAGTPIPQLLIINIQLPTYAPSLWGGKSDGPGCSIVFCFRLRPDFDPDTFANQKALQLFERFLTGGSEADGMPTRDRFKLIGRVVNVDEWATQGPLSTAEHRLLTAYNEKPLLTRPQHRFHSGDNYLEVDIDIHAYTYIARAAFQAYVARLGPVVWENAFVIQGNTADELPEQVLAAARVYRTDLTKLKPQSSYMS